MDQESKKQRRQRRAFTGEFKAGARRRVEAHHRCHDIARLTRLGFGQSHLRILGVGEASCWSHHVFDRHGGPSHGVGRRREAVLQCLGYEHEAPGHVSEKNTRTPAVVFFLRKAQRPEAMVGQRDADPHVARRAGRVGGRRHDGREPPHQLASCPAVVDAEQE
jgi:hypothetical protein